MSSRELLADIRELHQDVPPEQYVNYLMANRKYFLELISLLDMCPADNMVSPHYTDQASQILRRDIDFYPDILKFPEQAARWDLKVPTPRDGDGAMLFRVVAAALDLDLIKDVQTRYTSLRDSSPGR